MFGIFCFEIKILLYEILEFLPYIQIISDKDFCIDKGDNPKSLTLNSGKVVFLFIWRFYGAVNSYSHVELVSNPLTLFLNRLRPTTRLSST